MASFFYVIDKKIADEKTRKDKESGMEPAQYEWFLFKLFSDECFR